MVMKTLFRIVIAFLLWALAGANRWLNKMKTEAVDMATEMYQSSMNMILSWSVEEQGGLDDWKNNAAQFLSGQIESFKKSAKDQASQSIKDQIDRIFQ
jgi:gas vesicle protein